MSDPMEHIAREPLPWQRDKGLTECGRSVDDIKVMVTREAMIAKVNREGRTRAAMTSCMTCWQTANRHELWRDDPCAAINRAYSGWSKDAGDRRELTALAMLVDRHREEYDGILTGLIDAPNLGDVRRAKHAGQPYLKRQLQLEDDE